MQVISRPTIPPGQGNITSFVGQRCMFLVSVEDEEGWFKGRSGFGTEVNISVTDSKMMGDVLVHPQAITPGQVAEVIVIPYETSTNGTLTFIITGERRGLKRTETKNIEVVKGEDTLNTYAEEMRNLFMPWLVSNHPEFGITNETDWVGTIVNPRILVVMHYIFLSEEWELYLTWHVTIPPHDWTRIYLRQRFSESRPSVAFEISSVIGLEEPTAIEVPDWV